MLFAPCVLMLVNVHVEPLSVPRKRSMVPRKIWPGLVGEAATYQSYQAWPVHGEFGSIAGKEVSFVQVVPARRHRCGVVPTAPNTKPTSGKALTRSTASRA